LFTFTFVTFTFDLRCYVYRLLLLLRCYVYVVYVYVYHVYVTVVYVCVALVTRLRLFTFGYGFTLFPFTFVWCVYVYTFVWLRLRVVYVYGLVTFTFDVYVVTFGYVYVYVCGLRLVTLLLLDLRLRYVVTFTVYVVVLLPRLRVGCYVYVVYVVVVTFTLHFVYVRLRFRLRSHVVVCCYLVVCCWLFGSRLLLRLRLFRYVRLRLVTFHVAFTFTFPRLIYVAFVYVCSRCTLFTFTRLVCLRLRLRSFTFVTFAFTLHLRLLRLIWLRCYVYVTLFVLRCLVTFGCSHGLRLRLVGSPRFTVCWLVGWLRLFTFTLRLFYVYVYVGCYTFTFTFGWLVTLRSFTFYPRLVTFTVVHGLRSLRLVWFTRLRLRLVYVYVFVVTPLRLPFTRLIPVAVWLDFGFYVRFTFWFYAHRGLVYTYRVYVPPVRSRSRSRLHRSTGLPPFGLRAAFGCFTFCVGCWITTVPLPRLPFTAVHRGWFTFAFAFCLPHFTATRLRWFICWFTALPFTVLRSVVRLRLDLIPHVYVDLRFYVDSFPLLRLRCVDLRLRYVGYV